jgi:cyclic pyranopterin phosphate synthase
MLEWCGAQGFDLTLIETMPLGAVDEDRTDRYLPLDGVRRTFAEQYTLIPLAHRSGGPARYVQVEELGLRLGFITPMTANFCDGCNRLRVSVQGKISMCLGHDDSVDLKAALRGGGRAALDALIDEALAAKPLRHHFSIGRGEAPSVQRHMSVTGG